MHKSRSLCRKPKPLLEDPNISSLAAENNNVQLCNSYLYINTCKSNIKVCKSWQTTHKGNFHVQMHHFYVLIKFAHLQICKLVFFFFLLMSISDSIFKVNKQSNGHHSEIWMVARCERHLLGYSSCINCSNSHRMFSRSLISSPEGAKSSTI